MKRVKSEPSRSNCPIATTLEFVGDSWSLVIIRDLLTGKCRYGQLLQSPEKITTSVLANRLAKLEDLGLIERRAYSHRPTRYEYRLTEKGAGLLPVLQEICRWANRHVPGTWTPPAMFMAMKPKGSNHL